MNVSIEEKLSEIKACMVEIKAEVKTLVNRGCMPGEKRLEKLKEHIDIEIAQCKAETDIKIERTTKHVKVVAALSYIIGVISAALGVKFNSLFK